MEEAQRFASEAETANFGPSEEPISVEIDQGVYQPGLDTSDAYLNAIRQGTPSAAPGHQMARQQEEARSKLLRDSGVGMSMADQFTAPLNDEMAGAVGYLSQGAGNLGRRLMGRDIEVSAAERGRAATDVARSDQDRFTRENPVQSFVGQTLGGFAFAPARAAGVAGGVQNMLRTSGGFMRPGRLANYAAAGATGAGYGAADAEGGFVDRAVGGGIGGLVGLGTAGAIDGGQALVRRMSPGVEGRLSGAMQRTLQADQMTPADFASRLDALPEGGLPMDVAGPNFRGVVEAAAQMPGPARTRIQGAIEGRQTGRADRLGERVSEGLGGTGDYIATLDNLVTQRREAANTVMSEIGTQPVRLDDASIRALRSPLARGEIQRAAQAALASPDQATYEMGANLNRLAETLLDNPAGAQIDVRTAQDLSRALLDMSSEAWRRGDGQQGRALGQIGGAVRQNARQSVQGYDQWLRRYGDESEQIGALELGRQVFRNAEDAAADGMSAAALRTRLSEMSETSQEMFRKGVGEAVIARARASRGDIGAMRDIMRSREIADRVRLAFPDEAAMSRFFQTLDQEVNAANLDNQVLGNSRTAFRGAAQKQFGAEPPPDQASNLIGSSLSGIALEGLRQGARGLGRTVARHRSLLENPAANDRLGQALTDPEVLRALLMNPRRPRGLIGGGRAPVGTIGSGYSAVTQ